MKKIKILEKIKSFKNNKNKKKGFTLLESIVSLAIFAIVATLFTTFVLISNKMLNDSYAIEHQNHNLRKAISTGKSAPEYNVITNIDKGQNTQLSQNDITGKQEVTGKITIDYNNARVIGPKKIGAQEQEGLYLGKKIQQITDEATIGHTPKKLDFQNESKNLKIDTATQFDEKKIPIGNQLIGNVYD